MNHYTITSVTVSGRSITFTDGHLSHDPLGGTWSATLYGVDVASAELLRQLGESEQRHETRFVSDDGREFTGLAVVEWNFDNGFGSVEFIPAGPLTIKG